MEHVAGEGCVSVILGRGPVALHCRAVPRCEICEIYVELRPAVEKSGLDDQFLPVDHHEAGIGFFL